MAVRNVIARHAMHVDPRKEFKEVIPTHLLEHETDDERVRIQRLWSKFTISVNELCKARRKSFVNKHLRRSVFDSGMDNLCKDISRQQVHIKVMWTCKHQSKSYRLELVRLSTIPDSCQPSGQWFVAEIPQIEYEAQAELVGFVPVDETLPQPEQQTLLDSAMRVTEVPAEVPLAVATPVATTTAPVVQAISIEPGVIPSTAIAVNVSRID